ncbi:MAG TPA: CoA-acylating methylmalonate-semialdehyde dehydrogenase [Solirubrobacterales bacterium]|nr:CoA-acylating methylmalonate-semialdehyde dehydrogenase [Solirubrobacterales bacterium]
MATAAEARTLRNFAGGAFVDAAARETLEDRDPATGELAARVPLSGAADVDAAVRAARQAQPAWRAVPPQQRARAVLALRDALVAHREELTALVTADMGKTLADADGEVGRGIESVESAAAIPHLLKGETLEGVATGLDVEMVRQPVGVVAAITPFNFPAMIPLWFLPYAVACGNAFILKPSERDPRPSARICELIAEHEIFPPGVVNLVHGGREAVESILDHPGIDAISFVGQASTARLIATRSAETGKRVQALGGAKNSMIVADDADLERSVPAILGSAFGAAGQRCLAGSVCVIVGDDARQAEVREALVSAARELSTGPGSDPDTDVCPMVSPEARERAEAAVAAAVSDGAEVLLDGRLGGGEAGALLGPTLVEVSDHDSELAREEIFGPVLALVGVPDLDAAIEFTNRSRYGNAGSIFTTSGAAARAYRWGIEAGMLGVNIGVPAPVAWFPFSGWKDSIDGDLHANGPDAVEFYTRKKVVTTRW